MMMVALTMTTTTTTTTTMMMIRLRFICSLHHSCSHRDVSEHAPLREGSPAGQVPTAVDPSLRLLLWTGMGLLRPQRRFQSRSLLLLPQKEGQGRQRQPSHHWSHLTPLTQRHRATPSNLERPHAE